MSEWPKEIELCDACNGRVLVGPPECECSDLGLHASYHVVSVIPADLGRQLYEATEYFAAQKDGDAIDWRRIKACQEHVRKARARYEQEVGP